MNWSVEGLASIIQVILAGGVGLILRDIVAYFIKKKSDESPATQRITEQAIIEKTLLNMSSSNDDLVAAVSRLREANAHLEVRGRAREDWWQARWDAREERFNEREGQMQDEIDTLRRKMLELVGELDSLRVRLTTHTE